MGNAERLQRCAGIGNAGGTAVGNVVARQCHCIEAGAWQCRQMGRISGRRRHITGHFVLAVTVWHFKMANHQIGGLQRWRDPRQPMIGAGFIQNDIAGEHQRLLQR